MEEVVVLRYFHGGLALLVRYRGVGILKHQALHDTPEKIAVGLTFAVV